MGRVIVRSRMHPDAFSGLGEHTVLSYSTDLKSYREEQFEKYQHTSYKFRPKSWSFRLICLAFLDKIVGHQKRPPTPFFIVHQRPSLLETPWTISLRFGDSKRPVHVQAKVFDEWHKPKHLHQQDISFSRRNSKILHRGGGVRDESPIWHNYGCQATDLKRLVLSCESYSRRQWYQILATISL